VGIGTTAPAAKLDIIGNIHVNTDNYKNEIGYFTGASGATGNNSTAIGYQTKASGDYSTAIGQSTTASGEASTAMGAYSGATGNFCTAIGNRAYAGGDIQFAIGASTSFPNTIAGAGSNNNVLSILKNGNVGIGTTGPNYILHIKGLGSNTAGIKIESTASGISQVPGNLIIQRNASGQCYIYSSGSNPLILGNEYRIPNHLYLKEDGNVGIGTNSPYYPLEVRGSVNANPSTMVAALRPQAIGSVNPIWNVLSGWTQSENQDLISICSEYSIWAQNGTLNTSSDRRIKKNIRDVPDDLSLIQLRNLPCVYYDYIDPILNSEQSTIGFIAQDVKEILPSAVSLEKNIIPNEMRDLENLNWETITDLSGNETFKLTISDLEDVSGNTKYRFYCSNDDLIEKQLEITSLENEPKSFIFEEKYDNLYLYGKEVDDFHILSKDKIFALNFSATQEIDKIQQEEKTKLAAAESKITDLETENATLKAQLSGFEARLVALEAN